MSTVFISMQCRNVNVIPVKLDVTNHGSQKYCPAFGIGFK